jgi:hypothetical protein
LHLAALRRTSISHLRPLRLGAACRYGPRDGCERNLGHPRTRGGSRPLLPQDRPRSEGRYRFSAMRMKKANEARLCAVTRTACPS